MSSGHTALLILTQHRWLWRGQDHVSSLANPPLSPIPVSLEHFFPLYFFFFEEKTSLVKHNFFPWTLILPALVQTQKYSPKGGSLQSQVTMPAAILVTSSISVAGGMRGWGGEASSLDAQCCGTALVPQSCGLIVSVSPGGLRNSFAAEVGLGDWAWAQSICLALGKHPPPSHLSCLSCYQEYKPSVLCSVYNQISKREKSIRCNKRELFKWHHFGLSCYSNDNFWGGHQTVQFIYNRRKVFLLCMVLKAFWTLLLGGFFLVALVFCFLVFLIIAKQPLKSD